MDRNALYYALSTIAMVAAALAALIGFLGMWRLDRLREEGRRLEDEVIAVVMQIQIQVQPAPVADILVLQGKTYFLQKAKTLIDNPQDAGDPGRVERVHSRLKPLYADYKAVQGKQRCLLVVLTVFLGVTLVGILAPAIVGIIHVDRLETWAWTPRLLYGASAWLAIASAIVVLVAAWPSRAMMTLAILLLALAIPALAGPVRCTTYEQKTMNQRYTVCDDGTRAVSTYNRTLDRWDTTITPPPGKTCTSRWDARTWQVEVRCR